MVMMEMEKEKEKEKEKTMENVKARGAVETIGIIGGGQLGSMLARVGLQWGYEVVVLDPSASAPAGKIASRHIVGDYTCPFAMAELVKTCDRITYEFEHLPEALIAGLKQAQAVTVPSLETLEIIQDKYRQKEHLRSHGLPVAPDCKGSGPLGKGFREFLDLHGEIVIKCTHGGYDGKGTYFVGGKEALAEALDYYGGAPVYAEAVVPFVKELSVMVAKRGDEIVAYPVVENCHDSGILVQTTVPAGVSEAAEKGAREIALAGVATFNSDGLFCVEMFLTGDGSIVINEIAPRAHNSGHYTIEACDISQYETWLRLLVDLPLVQPMLLSPAAMVNVLGPVGVEGPYKVRGLDALAGVPNTKFHLYGKANTGARKKLGHITSLGSSAGEALERAQLALDAVGIESSIFDAPLPQVGIIMGSQSDLRIMGDAAVVLKEFGIPYEIKVVSAHRTPKRLFGYGESARDRGLKVIIAGAGGAAHLPGMMASITTLPVIGVPVKLKALDGMDSLLSIVQMPGGIPVATVGVDNAKNAGLLAVRILAAFDPGIFEQLDRYMKKISAGVVYDLEEVL